MYMPAQIQLKTVEMVEIEPESDVQISPVISHRRSCSRRCCDEDELGPPDCMICGSMWLDPRSVATSAHSTITIVRCRSYDSTPIAHAREQHCQRWRAEIGARTLMPVKTKPL